VWADEVYLEHVVRNLIENAAKFSRPETVIAVSACDDERHASISVTDHGPGVPLEEQPYVFDAFYRGHANQSDRAGHGLGLYFARRLTEAQHGAISVRSPAFPGQPGPGATFTVTVPIADGDC
jgi:signal transduction histidine kinase